MKILKPLRLGAMTRVYEVGSQPYLVVTALAFFPLDAPDVLLGEQELWRVLGGELSMARPPLGEVDTSGFDTSAAILDEGLPKPGAEVLVRGSAHPPGAPQPGCSVRVVVGAGSRKVDKTLQVSGDRKWDFLGMSMPEPFTTMPLGWSRAFGGAGHGPNPVGRGAAPTRGADGKSVHWLPNVEHPSHLVKYKGDRPPPASFSPIDASWPQRTSKMGTFDQRWLETQYPGLPTDMDLAAFATAPEDQRIDGFLEGGEPFLLENMHPSRPRIEGVLPHLRAVAFLRRRGDDALVEIPMRLDTVQLFPERERGLLSFRGLVEIQEDDAHDVTHLMLGAERTDAPRDRAHYQRVFATRIDPEAGAVAAIVDQDLLPPVPAWDGAGKADDVEQYVRRDRLLERNQVERARRDHAGLVGEIRAAGLDPVEMGVPAEPPLGELMAPLPTPDQAVQIVRDAARDDADEDARAETRKREAEARARALCGEHGVDYDALMGEETGGPPTFSAEAELARMRAGIATAGDLGVSLDQLAARVDDPEFAAGLRQREQELKDLYRSAAHLMPRAAVPPEDVARILGGRAVAARDGQVAMVDQDLTGAQLHGADLAGVDLGLAFLERADLSEARLAGARLHRAVLTRADLAGADLTGADLTGANLGEADLTGADLSGADLSGAILYRANLTGTRLHGARLTGVDAWEVRLVNASLARAAIEKTHFVHATLERVDATGATLREVSFLESDVPGLDLAEATVSELSFVATRGEGAVFRGARLTGLRMVGDSAFPGADFEGAHLGGAALRGTDLERARFAAADLSGADLSECRAHGADLRRAIATGTMFVRTDLSGADLTEAKLLDAVLHKADLRGARLVGANLFQADLAGAKGDPDTDFGGANLGRVRKTRRSL